MKDYCILLSLLCLYNATHTRPDCCDERLKRSANARAMNMGTEETVALVLATAHPKLRERCSWSCDAHARAGGGLGGGLNPFPARVP